MTHGSLFSGIGGFDLAAHWMGWTNLFHCEWNEFGQRVLKHYWPEAQSYGDITKTDFSGWHGAVDVISGGFPCQPYSLAGKRLGKEDERHLWPHMLRAIREISPRYVVGENVRGLLTWNDGLVFNEVCADLENEGYKVTPYLVPACGVNAPHRRDRIWFVAHSESNGGHRTSKETSCAVRRSDRQQNQQPSKRSQIRNAPNTNGSGRQECNPSAKSRKEGQPRGIPHPNTDGIRSQRGRDRADGVRQETQQGQVEICCNSGTPANNQCLRSSRKEHGQEKSRLNSQAYQRPGWGNFPTQSPVRSGDDGFSAQLDSITFPKWRNESIKAYGNAIVPQVAYQIFKAIVDAESKM